MDNNLYPNNLKVTSKKLIESLSPHEVKILPYLKEENIGEIARRAQIDKVSVMRALEYLQNKKIVELVTETKKIVEIGVNGALYRSKGLPERRLLHVLDAKRILGLKEAQKEACLDDDEFKASLGALKKKAMIELKNGKLILSASKSEIAKKSLEEQFIEALPLELDKLESEQKLALQMLQKRKDIIEIKEEKKIKISVTKLGEELMKSNVKHVDMIEVITPELLKKESSWKGKKFRRYDVDSQVPSISGGKRHFVNQAVDHARRVWTDMGFEEMTGNVVQSSFWVFDSLFTAQDHPVREMQDTFFINKNAELPGSEQVRASSSKNDRELDKKLVKIVKDAHEKGVGGSKGWKYEWKEDEAKKMVLRTHTTCLSAQTLYEMQKKGIARGKYFALGRNFRNETVDWSHGFEFNQSEGIVVGEGLNFRNLLGYLKQFFNKMGIEKIRFSPAYFPYTEPSVEIHAWHPEKKVWLELGGAGMFRPEITIPLLGKHIPVLAWGPGFDRMIMDSYKILDLREFYKNDLNKLRKMKFWVK